MKKIVFSLVGVFMCATFAFAEWQVAFIDNYTKKGIDQAVIDALKEGGTADGIVKKGITIEGLNHQNLVKALYCARVNGADILAAAELYEIPSLIVTAGYKKSLEECSGVDVDAQAYTPVPTTVSFGGASSPSTGGGTYASPSTL